MIIDIEARKERAVVFFKEGYNCSQSVVMAYADLYDLDMETAKKISASFGGGMGRLREVCGAVSGMFIILGLHSPASDPTNKITKSENYAAVQRTAQVFKDRFGSYICADLLQVKRLPQSPNPSDRNAEYYAKQPCARFVAEAAEILGREILRNENERGL